MNCTTLGRGVTFYALEVLQVFGQHREVSIAESQLQLEVGLCQLDGGIGDVTQPVHQFGSSFEGVHRR